MMKRNPLRNPLKDYLSTMEVALQVGVSDARIRQMIAAEKVPAVKVGSSWLIHIDDVAVILNRKDGRRKA